MKAIVKNIFSYLLDNYVQNYQNNKRFYAIFFTLILTFYVLVRMTFISSQVGQLFDYVFFENRLFSFIYIFSLLIPCVANNNNVNKIDVRGLAEKKQLLIYYVVLLVLGSWFLITLSNLYSYQEDLTIVEFVVEWLLCMGLVRVLTRYNRSPLKLNELLFVAFIVVLMLKAVLLESAYIAIILFDFANFIPEGELTLVIKFIISLLFYSIVTPIAVCILKGATELEKGREEAQF